MEGEEKRKEKSKPGLFMSPNSAVKVKDRYTVKQKLVKKNIKRNRPPVYQGWFI
jgi:hypothetical protein